MSQAMPCTLAPLVGGFLAPNQEPGEPPLRLRLDGADTEKLGMFYWNSLLTLAFFDDDDA
jgi:hypothetical protein